MFDVVRFSLLLVLKLCWSEGVKYVLNEETDVFLSVFLMEMKYCEQQNWLCLLLYSHLLFVSGATKYLILLFSHPAVQYSTVQYSTVQYSTAQYSTVQYSTVQYSSVPQDL